MYQGELGALPNQEFENPSVLANPARTRANVIHLAYDRKRVIRTCAHPTVDELNRCIIKLKIQAATLS